MQVNRIIIAVSFAWLLVSFWHRNELPGNIDYVPELGNEPVQMTTGTPAPRQASIIRVPLGN